MVGRVLEHNLADVNLALLLSGLRFSRQVDIDALLSQGESGHEDDQQHEQHVDERRDVHVGVGRRDRGFDDLLGAVSAGIAEALVETALGLIVAIPAVWFYNYLTGRIEYFNVEMDNSSSELVDYFIRQTS